MQQLKLKPGKYVLAVSGGVDSMVLLNMLSNFNGVEIIVAHFNHGIRSDAGLDEELVVGAANSYGLKVEVGRARLGPRASEALAREARYNFLQKVKKAHKADGIITAHHQDDLLETALLNLLRGSGRRGLSAMADSSIVRPLLHMPKSQIIAYATQNHIKWREDSTNAQDKYLRNRLRRHIAKLNEQQKQAALNSLNKVIETNKKLNSQLENLSAQVNQNGQINRGAFISLPADINNELIMHWLRQLNVRQFDKKMINRLNMALKTSRAGTKHDVLDDIRLEVGQKSAHFTTSGRMA